MSSTYTISTLEVSFETYDEIEKKLNDAGVGAAHIFSDGHIELTGISLECGEPRQNSREKELRRELNAAYAALDRINYYCNPHKGETWDAIRETAQDALSARTPFLVPREPISVFPDWMATLAMQQQSVLVLGARGPDGVRKHHPCKDVVRAYRACVLKAAYYGRDMAVGEAADHFMSLDLIANRASWALTMKAFFENVDELPHHYYLHLAHGAEILGYKHPDPILRARWRHFYTLCCDDMHLTPESERAMDRRLGDWGRKHWGEPPVISVPVSEVE